MNSNDNKHNNNTRNQPAANPNRTKIKRWKFILILFFIICRNARQVHAVWKFCNNLNIFFLVDYFLPHSFADNEQYYVDKVYWFEWKKNGAIKKYRLYVFVEKEKRRELDSMKLETPHN